MPVFEFPNATSEDQLTVRTFTDPFTNERREYQLNYDEFFIQSEPNELRIPSFTVRTYIQCDLTLSQPLVKYLLFFCFFLRCLFCCSV